MSHALEVTGLLPLMQRTSGIAEVTVAIIDGPVAVAHPDLARERIRYVTDANRTAEHRGMAYVHGTFVAGILCAKRSSAAPAICPGCTTLVRPIFGATLSSTASTTSRRGDAPRATPSDLAQAIVECVEAGARVINISAAVEQATSHSAQLLNDALDRAARRGAIVVSAAGNQASIGGSPMTSHPWVIPVAACTQQGQPAVYSNLGHSIGRRGLRAPGDRITSLGASGAPITLSGTSAAAPFVTGAIALLWSEFPRASALTVHTAITQAGTARRASIFPPLLNAWDAYQSLKVRGARRVAMYA